MEHATNPLANSVDLVAKVWWYVNVFVVQVAILNTYIYISANASDNAALGIAWALFVITGTVTAIITNVWYHTHPASLRKQWSNAIIPVVVVFQMALGASVNYIASPVTERGLLLVWLWTLTTVSLSMCYINRNYLDCSADSTYSSVST